MPLSDKGRTWIADEMILDKKHAADLAVTINSEFAEDIIETLKENGLEVEIK